MQTAAETPSDHRLTLGEVLDELVTDHLVERAEADRLIAERRMHRGDHHPLVLVADQKWKMPMPPGKVMHLEWMTEWLAKKAGLDYYHIDPLKINFSSVTDVMSNAYATRFKILPVEVTTREVVIATASPPLLARRWSACRTLRAVLISISTSP